MSNQPGGAADVVSHFSEAGVGITYMYAFLLDGRGILVFRTNQEELAREVVTRCGLRVLSADDLPF